MQLSDLLGKSISDLSEEELEFKFRELKKLKLVTSKATTKTSTTKKKSAAPKTNADKQLANMLKGMTANERKALEELLK